MHKQLSNYFSIAETIGKINIYIDKIMDGGIVFAFSGGVDSTFLLHILSENRKKNVFPFIALIMTSSFFTNDESNHAVELVKQYHIPYRVLSFSPFDIPQVRNNNTDRCYRCKHAMFNQFKKVANELHYQSILDGTNADDLKTYRPGIRALCELGIRSPLAELGITKKMTRACSIELGLNCAKQASKPCLATRFEYNTILTEDMLSRVAEGEKYLLNLLGNTIDFRLRIQNDIVRIEVPQSDMPVILTNHAEIVAKLKSLGYRFICLDLEGFRSGCYDTESFTQDNE